MPTFIHIVGLFCGKFNRKYDVSGMTDNEIEAFKKKLKVDRRKEFLTVVKS